MERWLPIPGFPGYEASDQGNIRSLDRMITRSDGRRYSYKGCLLNPNINVRGYRRVSIRGNQPLVAALVLETFVGPRPSPMAVTRHLSDDKSDNRLVNLAWGTQAENIQDSIRNGLAPNGERSGNAKLTEIDVLCIRGILSKMRPRSRQIGVLQRSLADQYGVRQETIYEIAARKTWRHI